MSDVTIVIPNYNGIAFLKTCLDSVLAQTGVQMDVIIIDNGSVDGSQEFISSNYPQCELVCLDQNYGFCRAVNEGINRAKSPYVILLNNDTEVRPLFAASLVASMKEDKSQFSCSARMLMYTKRDLLDDAGDFYCAFGWGIARGKGRPKQEYGTADQIFSACGGAAIYQTEMVRLIGGFDEAHFAYLEDIDVGYRARIAGYDNIYCPAALVWHVGSGTSGSKYNSFKVKLAARNNVYLNYKNMPCLQLIINAIPIAAGIFVKYSFFRKLGFGKDYLEGLKEGIRTAKKCKKVAYRPERLKNYLAIELELLAGTFLYVYEFAVRQIEKKAASDKS